MNISGYNLTMLPRDPMQVCRYEPVSCSITFPTSLLLALGGAIILCACLYYFPRKDYLRIAAGILIGWILSLGIIALEILWQQGATF